MANSKEPYILLTMYQNLYKDKYGRAVTINKFREKWAMQDVIDSIGFDRAVELLNYYFKIDRPNHQLQWFLYNFDKLDDVLHQLNLDKLNRERIFLATKKMVEENSEH